MLNAEHTPTKLSPATCILGMQQHEKEIYEEIMRRGRKEGFGQAQDFYGPMLEEMQETQLEAVKLIGEKEGYKRGVKDGEERGRTAEQEVWETKHGQGRCVEPQTWVRVDESIQMESTTCGTTDLSTQTAATRIVDSTTQTASTSTADATMQTAPHDDTHTSPSPPLSPATSPLLTPAQPPSTLPTPSTTATTTSSPASKQPTAACKRRHSLPNQPTAAHPSPQPRFLHPEPPVATATSPPTTTTKTASTAPEMMIWATASTQTASDTLGIVIPAVNDVQGLPTAEETNSQDGEQTCLSKCVIYSTDKPCQPHLPQRRPILPPTPPCFPLLAPQTPVVPHEPTAMPHVSTSSAMSPLARLSTTTEPPASPHSKPLATAQKQWRTMPEPPEQPPNTFQPPSSPQTPCKRAVSPPPVWYTPPTSPTTLSMPRESPCSPPVPLSLPIRPSSPQLSPRRAVSPSPPSLTATDVSEPPSSAVLQPQSLVSPPSSPVPSRPTPAPTRLTGLKILLRCQPHLSCIHHHGISQL
jgi:hypothetical protein